MTAEMPNLSDLLLLAKAWAVAHPDRIPARSGMAPGVTDAEAHVAAWHAIGAQGGMTSPEREAIRLSADYGYMSRMASDAEQRAVTNESLVDMELVAEIVGPQALAEAVAYRLSQMRPADAERLKAEAVQPAPVTNDRGEYTGVDGKLYHHVHQESPFESTQHEGPWLTCDGCNPVVVLEPNVLEAPEMVAARARYAEAKQAADAAAETLKGATAKLKAAMTEASGGAYRTVLNVPGFRPVNLTYVESWRVDTKRLKADHPLLYVDLAERSGAWRLEQSKAK